MNKGLADYLQEVGLSEDPFADVVDEELFFSTPQLDQRLNLIHHLLRYSDLLLLVTGPTGSGKTTLVNQLTANPTVPWHISVVEADSEMDAQQLWQKIFEGFDLPDAGARAGKRAGALTPYLEQWSKRGQTAVLAMDEAHLLPSGTLSQILGTATQLAASRLRVVLLGTPQLEGMMGNTAHDSRHRSIVHVVDVPPLSRDQTAEYIRFRLARAGLDAADTFPDSALRRLHKESGGLPGAINRLARDSLADRLAASRPSLTEAVADHEPPQSKRRSEMPVVIALVAVAAVLTWLFTAPPATPPSEPLPLPAPSEPVPPPASRVPVASYPAAPIPEAAPGTGQPPPAAAAQIIPLTPSPAAPDAEAAAPAMIVVQDEPAMPQTPLETPVLKESIAEATEAPAPPDEPPTTQPAAPDTPEAPASSTRHDEVWLLDQEPEHYTIQLTGTRERDAALDFITGNGLMGQAIWFRALHKGQDWYVVVRGRYPSRDAAVLEISALPETLRQHRPWARSFASVQQSIRDAQRAPRGH